MYSPSLSTSLQQHRRRVRLAPCSSSVVLPLMPSWFERTVALTVVASALLSIVTVAVSGG